MTGTVALLSSILHQYGNIKELIKCTWKWVNRERGGSNDFELKN
jgi:hypothetical protein